ncbi:unnamed protein product [Withania somnifera]
MECFNKGWEVLSRKIKNFLERKKRIENKETIAERWELLSGKNNWEGLLDPLDYDLRRYLIHYGQMPQAICDSFNNEEASKYRGTSRYSKKNLFTTVGLDKNNPYRYEITKYVYAASDVPSNTEKVKESNWIGFVAVATDEGKVALGRRDILIAWRGTQRVSEWNDDFDSSLVQPTEIFGENTNNILVHKGFYSIYTSLNEASNFNRTTSARDQVLQELKRLLDQYKKEEVSISVTGHSLGSSLATRGLVDGSTNDWRLYDHVGFELSIDTTKSEYLKEYVNGHILEVYLHGIAGTEGAKGEFKLEISRDIALVNKEGDFLKDEYDVPASWWIEKNKGMIQQEDGSWILMDHEVDTYFLP